MGERQAETSFGQPLAHWRAVALTLVSLVLPLLLPGFGWLYLFIPLPAFCFLVLCGERQGSKIVGTAMVLAAIGAALLQVFQIFLFTATFLAVAFSLARSVRLHKQPDAAGGRAAAALLAGWLFITAGYGMVYKANLYSDLLTSIDRGIEAAYPLYLESTELPPDLKKDVGLAFDSVRQTMPKILPSLLGIWLLLTIWLTMGCGAAIIRKRSPDSMPWPPYSDWRLPDVLVWLLIASGILLFLPGASIRLAGLNGLIISLMLYFFQGVAVLTTLFIRWRVPTPVRVLIYLLTFMQLYGPLFISVLGLIDVWANFKKLRGSTTM